MAHLRQLHECDDCGSSFYLTGIDTTKRVAEFCPYCGSDKLQDEQCEETLELFEPK
jgi:predicted  nucleic acid-binding Zn-ribbon protein